MFIEHPPMLYRLLFPEAIWRINRPGIKAAYLTFDDGPIPEVTPAVLEILDRYNVKATFFMVGDNVARHPELLDEVRRRGHAVGNHTMKHIQGFKCTWRTYARNIADADELVLDNVKRYARDGSIIVFHDSLKARDRMLPVLPQAIEWLLANGFTLLPLGQ